MTSQMKVVDLFSKTTSTKKLKQGYSCECNKGMWSVSAPTKKQAEGEGYHYWMQYFMDGEYAL